MHAVGDGRPYQQHKREGNAFTALPCTQPRHINSQVVISTSFTS